jgi:hypothetical protein
LCARPSKIRYALEYVAGEYARQFLQVKLRGLTDDNDDDDDEVEYLF